MIDREAVEERVRELSWLMRTHGGGLELESVADDGTVSVRFTGMCTGCRFRPLTMTGTIRRGMDSIPGVLRVEAAGARISEEAEERLAELLSATPNPWRPDVTV